MRKLVLLAAVASLCAGVAFAQAPQGGPPPPDGPRHERHDMLADADTNHDGVISRQEFDAAHARMFDRLDTNHDGFLTREDHPEGMMRMRDGPGGPGGPGERGRWLERLDTNHDGNISRDEFLAGPIEHFN